VGLELLGEFLDRGAFAGVVAGHDECGPEGAGFETSMETGLAGDQGVAAESCGVGKKVSGSPTGDADNFARLVEVTDVRVLLGGADLLEPLEQFGQLEWKRELSLPPCPVCGLRLRANWLNVS